MDKIPKNNKREAIIRHVGTGKILKINNGPDPFISYIRVMLMPYVVTGTYFARCGRTS